MARQSNVPIVYQVLTQEGGLSPVAAAGFIGRLQQESGQDLNPSAHGDKSIAGGGSRGIGQWNRERKNNLMAFAGDAWQDPAMQARFALHEMGIGGNPKLPGYGSEAGTGHALKNAQSLEHAAIAAMSYERPQGWTAKNPTAGHGYGNTIRNGQKLAEQFADPATLAQMKAQAPAGGAASPESAAAGQRYGAGRPMDPVAAAGGVPMPQPIMNDAYGGATAGAVPEQVQPPNAFPPAPQAPLTMREKLAKAMKGIGGAVGAMGKPAQGTTPFAPGPGNVISSEASLSPVDPQQAQAKQQTMEMALQRLNSGRLFG